MAAKFHTASFEVFGRVQGVFFRKYTKKTATSLTVVGWVMNTPRSTVIGCIQGNHDHLVQMKINHNIMKPVVAMLGLLSIFTCATFCLYFMSSLLPSSNGKYKLSFPSNIDGLKNMVEFLKDYRDEHLSNVLIVFCAAYLYKQTFSIPGSVFMNLLAGALFGMPYSFFLTCLLTATGASCCFLISAVFGKTILNCYFKNKLENARKKMKENEDGLFFYLLCVRLFPMSPNWFLNMSFGILGVPIYLFFPSVFIGLMPYNFMCCQTGCILSEIKSVNDVMTKATMLKLTLVAFIVALPGFLLKKYKKKALRFE